MPNADDSKPDFEALRLRLSRLRHDRGWSYDELAARTHVSRRGLIDIETGRSKGSLESWFAIARGFDISLSELLDIL